MRAGELSVPRTQRRNGIGGNRYQRGYVRREPAFGNAIEPVRVLVLTPDMIRRNDETVRRLEQLLRAREGESG